MHTWSTTCMHKMHIVYSNLRWMASFNVWLNIRKMAVKLKQRHIRWPTTTGRNENCNFSKRKKCVVFRINQIQWKSWKKKIRAKTEKTKQNMGNSMKTTENQTDSKKTNIPTGKTETSEEKKTENSLRIRKGNNGKKMK